MSERCSKCGISLKRELLLALMIDHCGAQTNRQPHECPEGGDHDFVLLAGAGTQEGST